METSLPDSASKNLLTPKGDVAVVQATRYDTLHGPDEQFEEY